MPDVPSAAPAGWFPDGTGQLRYWDGATWTQHVAPMVQPTAAQVYAPSAAATAAVAASQQADAGRNAQAAEVAREKALRAAESVQAKAVRDAEAEQRRAAKLTQREATMQAKAAEREAAARDKSARAAAATVAMPVPPRKGDTAAPVAASAPTSVITDTRPSRHPATTWVIVSVVALAVLFVTAAGGFGGMFVSLGLVGVATALYPYATGRRSWIPILTTRSRNGIAALGAAVLIVIGATVPVAATAPGPRQADAISASASPTPTSTPTPIATPTPVIHVVEDVSTKTATDARTLLREAGYVVQYVLESGEQTSATDGMTVTSQSPTPGSRVDAGSTVTLTLLAPAPAPTVEPAVEPAPAPAPAAPVPAPKPAAPAPAPVAPAPAPAPAAPAPAPAPQTGLIKPGTYCSPSQVGQVAQAANGRSYTCGGKGADNSGDFHWNAM